MTTAREKAEKWVNDNIVLAEHCVMEYDELYDKLETLLSPSNQWISVEDRLPEVADEQYICYCKNTSGGELVIALIWNGEDWGAEDGELGDKIRWNNYVTRWCPLPSPPTA